MLFCKSEKCPEGSSSRRLLKVRLRFSQILNTITLQDTISIILYLECRKLSYSSLSISRHSALTRPVSSLVAQLVAEHEVGAELDPDVQSEDDRQADPIVRFLHV